MTIRRLNFVWAALVGLTLASFLLSDETGLTGMSAAALFAIAAFKSELVLTNFMEAGHAERHWLWLYRLWIAAVTVILVAGFAV